MALCLNPTDASGHQTPNVATGLGRSSVVSGSRRMSDRQWVRDLLARLERAADAAQSGDPAAALDTYAFALQALFARWPSHLDTEDTLDEWFEQLADGNEQAYLTGRLADVLWLRAVLDLEDQRRSATLHDLAGEIAARLDEDEELHRDARLTQAMMQLVEGGSKNVSEAIRLCDKFSDDPWLPLELSRVCGLLRTPENRDLGLASYFSERALNTGGNEVDLHVYGDRVALLQMSDEKHRIEEFDLEFWTPERICRALASYGPTLPAGTIKAALRLKDRLREPLVALIEESVGKLTNPLLGPEHEEQQELSLWEAIHGFRLAAAFGLGEVAASLAHALDCDAAELREVLPVAAAGLPDSIPHLRRALLDHERGIMARIDSIRCLTAVAAANTQPRDNVKRILRRTTFDASMPRALRSEAAFGLMGLRDDSSRATVVELLAAGELDRDRFDEQDIDEAFADDAPPLKVELGLDESPLGCYFDRPQKFPWSETEEMETERIAELVIHLSEQMMASELGETAAAPLGAEFARARARILAVLIGDIDLPIWIEAARSFMGPGGIPAHHIQSLELERDFADFMALDFILEETGRSVVQRLLVEPPLMSADELQALHALAESQVSLLDVLDSPEERGPGGRARCRDLLNDSTAFITLPPGLVPLRWDVLVGRVACHPREGHILLYGSTYPRVHLPALLSSLGTLLHDLIAVLPVNATTAVTLRVAAACMYARRQRAEAESGGPVPRNIEGEVVLACEAHYHVAASEEAAAKLAALPELTSVSDETAEAGQRNGRGGACFRWLGREGDVAALPDARRIYGEVQLHGGRLVLSCHSREWLARGRTLLEENLGTTLQHLADTVADPELSPAAMPHERPIDTEESRRIEQTLIEHHYEKWLDQPSPALGGKSPREASKEREARDTLLDLLRTIDNLEAHRGRLTGVTCDTTWLYSELGLATRKQPKSSPKGGGG